MPFLATGTYRIERGNGSDGYGDDIDVASQRWRDVLGAVSEQSRTAFDPSSGRPVTIRKVTGRFPSNQSLQAGDRVIDQADETRRFTVTEVSDPTFWAGMAGDVVCALTRDTSV